MATLAAIRTAASTNSSWGSLAEHVQTQASERGGCSLTADSSWLRVWANSAGVTGFIDGTGSVSDLDRLLLVSLLHSVTWGPHAGPYRSTNHPACCVCPAPPVAALGLDSSFFLSQSCTVPLSLDLSNLYPVLPFVLHIMCSPCYLWETQLASIPSLTS